MHRMQGVLAVVPPLHTLFGKGTLVETNKTLSRPTLTVQDMTVDEAIQPILPLVDTPRCDLRPSPGTATEVANEEKREVLPPWGRCLAVSRSLVEVIVSWLSSVSLSIHAMSIQRLNTACGQLLALSGTPDGAVFIPMTGSQGLSKWRPG
jgi:hypothetical protein